MLLDLSPQHGIFLGKHCEGKGTQTIRGASCSPIFQFRTFAKLPISARITMPLYTLLSRVWPDLAHWETGL